MTDRIVCIRCGKEGHRSGQCQWPAEIAQSKAIALTRRQHQILTLVSLGHEDKVIARKLNLAHSTVKDHAHAAVRAMGGANRAAACTIAVRMGVI